MKNAPVPQFAGMSAPSTNFDTLIDGTRSTPFVFELDLTTARSFAAGTAVQVKITGNCLLIDSAPDVGNGYVIFEGVQDNTAGQVRAPIYAQPGFVTRLPFANVYVANAAQPGKKLRFIYGVDLDFQMMFPAQINAIPGALTYSTAFSSTTSLAAFGALQIFSPAQNTNGAIIKRINSYSSSAAGQVISFNAHTSAPGLMTDGDAIACGICGRFSAELSTWLETPVMIPPGKGFYRFSTALETSNQTIVLYSLL